MSINRVIITGNLTRDPELKQTSGGTVILKMRLAVNGREKKGDQWVDRAEYVDCTMFGTRAESVSRFLNKGTKVGIDGKLRYHEWEKDGAKRSALEVVVDDLELLTPKGSSANSDAPRESGSYNAPAADDADGEDIPF